MSSSSNQGPPPDAPASGAVISRASQASRRTPETFAITANERSRSGKFEESIDERPKSRSKSKVRGGPSTRMKSRAPEIELSKTKKRERIGEE